MAIGGRQQVRSESPIGELMSLSERSHTDDLKELRIALARCQCHPHPSPDDPWQGVQSCTESAELLGAARAAGEFQGGVVHESP